MIWLISFITTIPWALFFDLVVIFSDAPEIQLCLEVWPDSLNGALYFLIANLVLCYILPMILISMCYILIWIKVWKRHIPTDTKDAQMERMQQKSKVKVVKMLVAVVILFVLSWLPLYVIFARIKFGGDIELWEEEILPIATPIAQWLGASNSCINPILYAFFNKKYRRGFMAIIKSRRCCGRLRYYETVAMMSSSTSMRKSSHYYNQNSSTRRIPPPPPCVTMIQDNAVSYICNNTAPPSSIEIVDHAPNSKIEIRENQEYQLECQVRNSKPAAQIVWYRNNLEYKTDKLEDHTIRVESATGRPSKRFDVISRITLIPTAEDDTASFTCEARHEALPPDMPMRVTVHLSVLYPPGMPYIEGYTEGETIRRGQQVSLICKSRGGNPPAQLIWYRNGEQVRMTYRTSNRESENVLTFVAEAADDKARYKCEASNIMSRSPLKTQVDLTVLFSPAHVTITGPTEGRVGDPIPLTCTTANSNPAAEIKWMVDGRQVRNATERNYISPEGGWITTSNITTVIEPGMRSLVVQCYGLNQQLTENVVSTHNINVLYPPSQPIIQGYTSGTPIPAGTVKKISCMSSGGNPLATLTWYKNDKKIPSQITKTDRSVTAEIKILVNATDNNAQYRCEASNAATEIPLFETITLDVYFAPDNVKIQKQPADLKPNTQATLTCDSSSSHPPARLSWWRQGIAVRGINNTTRPGLHGGFVSSIELKINVTEDMNGIVYTCQATNEALQRSVHDAITLQVLYKPVFDRNSPQFVTGIENESLVITVKADGNPPNIAYTWTKDGLPISRVGSSSTTSLSDRIISDGPMLNITKVHRNDAGIYSCEATNSQGGNMLNINVTVQYGITIKSVTENVIVNPNSDAILQCVVDGNPLTENFVTWERSNYDMDAKTTTNFNSENGTFSLIIHEASRADVGEFTCVGNNGIGNETKRKVLFIVKFKPELDTSPSLMKSAADVGSQARLICRASGAPNVKFIWSREGASIQSNSSSKYFVEYHKRDALTYESILVIQRVISSDYGPYECVAKNEMGFASTTVRLEVMSPPDTPVSISVLNVTHDSVTVAWTPGFDGGMRSSYRVRYRLINEDTYKYQDVPSDNQTMLTIKGLELDSEYVFSVMAMNQLGASKYLPDLTRAKTLSQLPPSYRSPTASDSSSDKTSQNFPGMLIIVGTISGTALILLNVLLIGCCLHHKAKKRVTEQSGHSSKSATIEMYAPSSYNDTVTGETLSSVSEKSETYSNEGSNADYVDEGRKQAASTYLIDQGDYPSPYPPNYPTYEMQMHSNRDLPPSHKTHTLPHPHHHHTHHNQTDITRTRDDQSVGSRKYDQSGNMSAKSSYISAPSPAPPADGSYYNVADRYLSYPPPLEFSHQHSHTPPMSTPPPSMPANGTLRRHHTNPRNNMAVPPDVLHNTSAGVQNQQILHPQGLQGQTGVLRSDCIPPMTTFSNVNNYQGPIEQEGHLV